MIKLIEDFLEFRRIRRLNRTVELQPLHRSLIYSYNKDQEKELNSLVLHRLAEEMIAGDVSPEYYRGFRSALTIRIALLGLKNTKFPINNK